MVLNSVEMTKDDINNQLNANVLPNLKKLLVRISKVQNKKSRNDLFGEVVERLNDVLPKKGFFGGDYKLKLASTDNNEISIGADDEPNTDPNGGPKAEPNADLKAEPNANPNGGPPAAPAAAAAAAAGGGRKRRRKKTRGRRLKKGGRKSKRR